MITPLALLVYAVLMGTVGARVLQHARWPRRSPRLGIWVWQSLTASVVLAVLLIGTTLALPDLPALKDLAKALHACLTVLRADYLTPGGVTVANVGVVLTILVGCRLGQVFLVHSWVIGRSRLRHRQVLLLLARRQPDTQTFVLSHVTPTAYCVPGRHGTIVFTSGALATLDADQAAAVLAHEQAHLRGRHHLVLALAEVLRSAFPFVPAFVIARTELAQLVEMRADDTALRTCQPQVLATALLALATGMVPSGAVGARGSSVVARAERLVSRSQPLHLPLAVLTLVLASAFVALPMLIAAAPAVMAAIHPGCSVEPM